MTPCEKLGYKVGDKFEVLRSTLGFKKGQVVTLFRDDGSKSPCFKGDNSDWDNAGGEPGACLCLCDVKHLSQRVTKPTVTPTLDQLLHDWRNADDFAKSKRTEADEAAAMRDERWQAVQARAGEMGVTVGRCDGVVTGDELQLPTPPCYEWRDWDGGIMPVSGDSTVIVKFRSGQVSTDTAGALRWRHSGVSGDIVAYRLARP